MRAALAKGRRGSHITDIEFEHLCKILMIGICEACEIMRRLA